MADNLSKLQRDLREKRDQIKAINAEFEAKLQPLKDAEALAEQKLINAMQNQNLTQVKDEAFTATLSTNVFPKIEDFDKFAMFIYKNKRADLFERRVARNAFKELLETRKGKPVPGVGTVEKSVILLRATGA